MKKAARLGYWQAIFNNGFKETGTGVLELPEHDADVFEVFIRWAYSITIGDDPDDFKSLEDCSASILIKTYALAEYFMIRTLSNAVIRAMWRKTGTERWWNVRFTSDAFEYYERRPQQGCCMDNLLIDWMVTDFIGTMNTRPEVDHDNNGVPERLVRAVLKVITIEKPCSRLRVQAVTSYLNYGRVTYEARRASNNDRLSGSEKTV